MKLKIIFICLILAFFGLVLSDLIASEEGEIVDLGSVTVTAYSPSPHITQGHPFQMASGRYAKPLDLDQLRYVAVSRDLLKKYNIKYGDTVWIAFQVEDTMNPRIKNSIDLFMRNLSLARKFGKQTRTVLFLKRKN